MHLPALTLEDLIQAFLVGSRLWRFLQYVFPTHPDRNQFPELISVGEDLCEKAFLRVDQLSLLIDQEAFEDWIQKDQTANQNDEARTKSFDISSSTASTTPSEISHEQYGQPFYSHASSDSAKMKPIEARRTSSNQLPGTTHQHHKSPRVRVSTVKEYEFYDDGGGVGDDEPQREKQHHQHRQMMRTVAAPPGPRTRSSGGGRRNGGDHYLQRVAEEYADEEMSTLMNEEESLLFKWRLMDEPTSITRTRSQPLRSGVLPQGAPISRTHSSRSARQYPQRQALFDGGHYSDERSRGRPKEQRDFVETTMTGHNAVERETALTRTPSSVSIKVGNRGNESVTSYPLDFGSRRVSGRRRGGLGEPYQPQVAEDGNIESAALNRDWEYFDNTAPVSKRLTGIPESRRKRSHQKSDRFLRDVTENIDDDDLFEIVSRKVLTEDVQDDEPYSSRSFEPPSLSPGVHNIPGRGKDHHRANHDEPPSGVSVGRVVAMGEDNEQLHYHRRCKLDPRSSVRVGCVLGAKEKKDNVPRRRRLPMHVGLSDDPPARNRTLRQNIRRLRCAKPYSEENYHDPTLMFHGKEEQRLEFTRRFQPFVDDTVGPRALAPYRNTDPSLHRSRHRPTPELVRQSHGDWGQGVFSVSGNPENVRQSDGHWGQGVGSRSDDPGSIQCFPHMIDSRRIPGPIRPCVLCLVSTQKEI